MSVRASTEITTQVGQIQGEIGDRKKPHQEVLNRAVVIYDLPNAYTPATLPKNITFGQLYDNICNRMKDLTKTIETQHRAMGRGRALDSMRRRTPEELKLSALEIANSETGLIERGSAAHKAIAEIDKQIDKVQGLFEALAGSLQSFSISVVGIVARYAV